jgi:hypothetical protein
MAVLNDSVRDNPHRSTRGRWNFGRLVAECSRRTRRTSDHLTCASEESLDLVEIVIGFGWDRCMRFDGHWLGFARRCQCRRYCGERFGFRKN